jgi:hypothetical protein
MVFVPLLGTFGCWERMVLKFALVMPDLFMRNHERNQSLMTRQWLVSQVLANQLDMDAAFGHVTFDDTPHVADPLR